MQASKALTAAASKGQNTGQPVENWRGAGEDESSTPEVFWRRATFKLRTQRGPAEFLQIHPFSSAVVIASIRFFAPSLLKISDM
ncbi:hypothetical protein PALA111701_16125 [Paenibacillus lactis]